MEREAERERETDREKYKERDRERERERECVRERVDRVCVLYEMDFVDSCLIPSSSLYTSYLQLLRARLIASRWLASCSSWMKLNGISVNW